MLSFIKSVVEDRRGVSAIEYALIAAAVLVAVGAGAAALSGPIGDKFTTAKSAITGS